MSDTFISKDGIRKLHAELAKLNKQKMEIAKEIGEAREDGDLKENIGYIAAKEKQALILERMKEIHEKISTARIIDELNIDKSAVRIGATVTVAEIPSNDESVYTLVCPEEADPAEGKISVNSPFAQGILGAKKNKKLTVVLPKGEVKLKILKIVYK